MSLQEAPIEFPETYITEDTFERQGWEKIDEIADEGDEESAPSGMYYYMLPLPKDNPSEDAPCLVSSINDEWKHIGLPKGSYVVEIGDSVGLGFCESEEQLEILYRALTGQEIED
jgi:hypothetical protein